jgi:hypothetical protein
VRVVWCVAAAAADLRRPRLTGRVVACCRPGVGGGGGAPAPHRPAPQHRSGARKVGPHPTTSGSCSGPPGRLLQCLPPHPMHSHSCLLTASSVCSARQIAGVVVVERNLAVLAANKCNPPVTRSPRAPSGSVLLWQPALEASGPVQVGGAQAALGQPLLNPWGYFPPHLARIQGRQHHMHALAACAATPQLPLPLPVPVHQ